MGKTLKKNAKDKVFKSLLQNRDNLAKFYYDLTGQKIDPTEIHFDTIASSIVKGKEEDIAFQIGNRYIILFEAQSTWSNKDIIRFATYMFLLFINFIDEHTDDMFENGKEITVPIIEAYVIYTGNRNLSDEVSLDELLPADKKSMINATMKIVTSRNAKGMVKEYIDFSKLETKYYTNGKRSKNDVIELIKFCIDNNILKEYMLEHRREVINMIENFFTEERRIQGLINDAVYESKKELEKVKADNKKNEERLLAENKKNEERLLAENKKNEERMKAREIIHLSQLKASPEKIAEITKFPLDFVKNVLENQHSFEDNSK